MKRIKDLTLFAAIALFCAPGQVRADVGYDILVDVGYSFNVSGIGGTASPDSAWARFTNVGASSFNGSITATGAAASGPGNDVNGVFSGILNPGDNAFFVMGPESSNQGGFNKVSGNPDNGIQLALNGTFTLGVDSAAAAHSIFDKDIHSGVFRTNPFGVTLDNYIMQGGDPFGRDTGDDYEVAQTPAAFHWAHSVQGSVPEPSLVVLALSVLSGGLISLRRRK